jgi:hypothetical protein
VQWCVQFEHVRTKLFGTVPLTVRALAVGAEMSRAALAAAALMVRAIVRRVEDILCSFSLCWCEDFVRNATLAHIEEEWK